MPPPSLRGPRTSSLCWCSSLSCPFFWWLTRINQKPKMLSFSVMKNTDMKLLLFLELFWQKQTWEISFKTRLWQVCFLLGFDGSLGYLRCSGWKTNNIYPYKYLSDCVGVRSKFAWVQSCKTTKELKNGPSSYFFPSYTFMAFNSCKMFPTYKNRHF